MEVYAKNSRVEKTLLSEKAARRAYGDMLGRLVLLRVQQLRALNNLAEILTLPLDFHSLGGDRKGQWSIKVLKNHKMVFIEAMDELAYLPDGAVDLSKITRVCIIEACVDYH